MLMDAYVGGGGYLKCLCKHFEFVKIFFISQKVKKILKFDTILELKQLKLDQFEKKGMRGMLGYAGGKLRANTFPLHAQGIESRGSL